MTTTSKQPMETNENTPTNRQNLLASRASKWFVRRDNKFYDVNRLNTPLSRNDIEKMIINRIAKLCPRAELSSELFKQLFKRIIDDKHTNIDQSIPVWNGLITCNAGSDNRFVWQDGAVAVNSWKQPSYRQLRLNEADLGIVGEFFDFVFQREEERDMFLNWLTWCLTNEESKPAWAPFFYSRTKGTGKSTICQIAAKLFGEENSVTQNSVEKLTSRFNATVLQSKLVISEELQLKPGSSQGNTLKTYITETKTMSEQKGREAERFDQCCCFLLTSNHLPTWIESDDRRYYVVSVDHDGHASGPRSGEFANLVGELNEYLDCPENIAKLYNALVSRQLPDTFSARTLNVVEDATPVMKQIRMSGRHTMVDQLEEVLNEKGLHIIPEADVSSFIRKMLGGSINQTKYLMEDIGWSKQKVKWDGVDYARSIWVRPGYSIEKGKLFAPDATSEPISDYLKRHDPFSDMDIIQGHWTCRGIVPLL